MSKIPAVRYIPKGAAKIASKLSSAVVYAYVSAKGKPSAIGYVGASAKPAFYCYFGNEIARANYVAKFMKDCDAAQAAKNARVLAKKAALAAPVGLKVGDVLVASWGYDQTNIDFYEVVRLVGKRSVAIREILSERKDCAAYMQGECVPLPGHFADKDEAGVVKRVDERNSVRITSYCSAHPADKILGPAGEFLGYRPHHWTAYA